MDVRLLTWNLFHGRDHPPDPSLFTWRSRLFRVTERGQRYAQVNRPLRREFLEVLARIEWDVALLQEAPPRWERTLAEALDAHAEIALTSRNSLGRVRGALAELNPDLIASNEGGSNQLLVRAPWSVKDVRRHVVAMVPERRVMLWAHLRDDAGRDLVVANVHGSVRRVPGARDQILATAARAVEWAADLPLVFGGDLNLSPAREPDVYEQLAQRFSLATPTARDAIDHLLVRGLDYAQPPHRLSPESREVRTADGLLLQLSDHCCVAATVSMK